jgi:phosphomannomutase
MEESFAKAFEGLIGDRVFYMVTGSDIVKIEEQIPKNILKMAAGIYASMGNEFYVDGKLVYQNDFCHDDDLIKRLELYRENTKYPHKLYPNFIEQRCGMINFCVVGRDCPEKIRQQYHDWDFVNVERLQIVKELSQVFTKYSFTVGGSISIDITLVGSGKEQVAKDLLKRYPSEKIIFFGDKTDRGGNDYDIAQVFLGSGNAEVITVKNQSETITFLRHL